MAVAITRTADPAGAASSGGVTTYSNLALTGSGTGRVVFVTVGAEVASDPQSATINFGDGAVAMSSTTLASFGSMRARIFYAVAHATAPTATVAITWSAAVTGVQNHISVYVASDASGTLNTSGTNTSTDMDSTAPLTTGSSTIPASGGMLAVAVGATDTVAKTWANLTEDLDADAGDFRYTTASSTTAGTATRTCTGGTNGEDGAMAWVIIAQQPAASSGSGTPASGAATVSGSGRSSSTGSGALSAQASTISGSGVSRSTGTGAPSSGAASVSGVGEIITPPATGSGALTSGAASVSGAGISSSAGSGAGAAQSSTIVGAGTSGSTGSGALLVGAASASGSGTSGSTGTGALTDSAATVAGAGTGSSSGSGAAQSGNASISGAGASGSSGAGVLVAGSASVSGTGTAGSAAVTGSGALQAAAASAVGSGVSGSIGFGALADGAASISGTGTSGSTGAGALAAASSSASGSGTVSGGSEGIQPNDERTVANYSIRVRAVTHRVLTQQQIVTRMSRRRRELKRAA